MNYKTNRTLPSNFKFCVMLLIFSGSEYPLGQNLGKLVACTFQQILLCINLLQRHCWVVIKKIKPLEVGGRDMFLTSTVEILFQDRSLPHPTKLFSTKQWTVYENLYCSKQHLHNKCTTNLKCAHFKYHGSISDHNLWDSVKPSGLRLGLKTIPRSENASVLPYSWLFKKKKSWTVPSAKFGKFLGFLPLF